MTVPAQTSNQSSAGTLAQQVITAAAIWDIFFVAPFALPNTASDFLAIMDGIGALLGLYGSIPAMQPGHMLFVNMAGMSGVIWTGYRLFAYNDGFVLAEFWVRLLIGCVLAGYGLQQSVSGIVGLFAVTEFCWAGAAAFVLWKMHNRR